MYNQQTFTNTYSASPLQVDISSRIIDELRELYLGHFDNHWFISLLEANAFNSSRLRYIHNMLEIQSVYSTETAVFTDAIETLKDLILTSKRYLLPALRDKLKVSGLYKNRSSESKEELVMRDLFSYTFPHNLQRLEELTLNLKENLE
jgi:hypothetical protein